MKKRNPGGGDLTGKQAALARRKRRQVKLRAAVERRTQWLAVRVGAMQQELTNAQARVSELESRLPPTEAPSDSAQG